MDHSLFSSPRLLHSSHLPLIRLRLALREMRRSRLESTVMVTSVVVLVVVLTACKVRTQCILLDSWNKYTSLFLFISSYGFFWCQWLRELSNGTIYTFEEGHYVTITIFEGDKSNGFFAIMKKAICLFRVRILLCHLGIISPSPRRLGTYFKATLRNI